MIAGISGTPQLVVKLIYGGGLRLLEALRLRVHDLDFPMRQITVRDGKGAKDRYTVLADSVIPPLQEHLVRVKQVHEADLRQGYGAVYLAIWNNVTTMLWFDATLGHRAAFATAFERDRTLRQPRKWSW